MFITSRFKANWWFKNRHLQTILGAVFRRTELPVTMKRWRLELADSDFIDVDTYLNKNNRDKSETVLLLHGLEGSTDSHYMQGIIKQLIDQNKQVVVMHFRGCSGEVNRLIQSYHSGVSDDLQEVIELLQERQLKVDYLVGFSLGGNVLLKWLGEERDHFQVKAAVAVSVPLMLNECANSIDAGFSKIYSGRLLKTLRIKTLDKKALFPSGVSLSNQEIKHLKSFWQFDHKVTAPIHGYASASDYYQKVSSRQFLKSINIPTLIIHAKDDPFMNSNVIPDKNELSESIQFELNEHGGHVGFISGRWPWKPEYYLDRRISEFLDQYQ